MLLRPANVTVLSGVQIPVWKSTVPNSGFHQTLQAKYWDGTLNSVTAASFLILSTSLFTAVQSFHIA
jgi:hypothetical protein